MQFHEQSTKPKKRRWLWVLVVVLGLGLFTAGYARFIEPNWIKVTHHTLVVEKTLSKPLKIAHLSDLHLRDMGFRERKILELLTNEKPDIIVITGDWVAPEGDIAVRHAFFKQLHAPSGVYAVRGNWEVNNAPIDHGFAETDVRLLKGEEVLLENGWSILGIDDYTPEHEEERRPPRSISAPLCMALFHEPAVWDQIDPPCTVSFSGHTHGGQVRIPGITPFWLPPGSGAYVEGWYHKQDQHMYVSRGLGTSMYQIRFFCRPELAFVTLTPQANAR